MRPLQSRRTETSRLYDRADEGHQDKKILDTSIGWQNYFDLKTRTWNKIDTSFSEPDGEGFTRKFTKLPRLVRMGTAGKRRLYPVPGNDAVWLQLYSPQELSLGSPTSQAKGAWTWEKPQYTFKLQVTPSGMKFEIFLPEKTGISALHIPFETSGLTREGTNILFNGATIAQIRKPTVADSLGQEREIETRISDGEIVLTLDDAGLVYPITIDPTIDLQIGAGENDGHSYDAGGGLTGYSNIAVVSVTGHTGSFYVWDSWYRFTGISGLFESTINVAYISLYEDSSMGSTGTPLTKIFADDQTAPSAPSNQPDHAGRTRTTVGVDWDVNPIPNQFNNSPSIVSVIQELADSYNPSVIQILHDDDGSLLTSYIRSRTHDYDSAKAPKLHIEYTSGGGGSPRRIFLIS